MVVVEDLQVCPHLVPAAGAVWMNAGVVVAVMTFQACCHAPHHVDHGHVDEVVHSEVLAETERDYGGERRRWEEQQV